MNQETSQHPHTYPIVCLKHQETCLYAEMIQTIESRQRCWLRPLLLQVMAEESPIPVASSLEAIAPAEIYDLRDASDLLWPLGDFHSASDTEILPVLTHLYADKPHPSADPTQISEQAQIARQKLHQFIQQVWQAKPNEVSAQSI